MLWTKDLGTVIKSPPPQGEERNEPLVGGTKKGGAEEPTIDRENETEKKTHSIRNCSEM